MPIFFEGAYSHYILHQYSRIRDFNRQIFNKMRAFITAIAILFAATAYAQDATYCLQLKIEPVKHKLSMKQLETGIIKYKLTNCSGQELIIDKNAATEYESETAIIFFKIYRCEADCLPYAYKKQYYKKVSDVVPYTVKASYSYTYDFLLFELYTIIEPGVYKIVGYYRKMIPGANGTPKEYLVASDAIDITVTK